ncbi:MAG: thiosulfate oxidation carrier complex protein SoxZ, partial [Burkholderiales bacterium]|nr:thiosulfate oxidation carrier complex protein SoxZ [Burkholderiales bacterium]
MAARIQLPKDARAGDVIEIRVIVQHAMETGYRYDDAGKLVPRNTIRELICRYDGEEILRVEMSSGVSANPYLQFYTVAKASGVIEFSWVDDAGVRESAA